MPHVPAYAYGEEIGALIERSGDTLSITRSYGSFCERIVNTDGPWGDVPHVGTAQIAEAMALVAESIRAAEAQVAEAKAREAQSTRAAESQAVVASKAKRRAKVYAYATVLFALMMSVTIWLWQKGYSLDQGLLKVQSLFVSIHLEPEMQSIPAGTFQQGDTHGRGKPDEKPVRRVTINPFAIGKFEVTFEEYDRFAIATSRPSPIDQRWGRGRRPVINVFRQDASDYAAWLSRQTGKRYRLLTESEWEYAARSGGKDDIWAGTSDEEQLKNYAVYAANSQNRTAPVW